MALRVKDLFEKLAYGELSNLSMAVDGTGGLKKERHNQIIRIANEALVKLFSRFALLETTETLTFTQTGTDPLTNLPVGYWTGTQSGNWGGLSTTLDPMFIQVKSIFTPFGESVPLENQPIPATSYIHDSAAIVPPVAPSTLPTITQAKTLYLLPVATQLQVTYQVQHLPLNPILSPGDLQQTIYLKDELVPALTAYIASKVYGGINSPDSVAMSASYKAQYEQTLMEASNQGLLPGELLPVQKLEARGFV